MKIIKMLMEVVDGFDDDDEDVDEHDADDEVDEYDYDDNYDEEDTDNDEKGR